MSSLSKTQAEKRLEELRGQIDYHSRLYYVLDKPEISDYEYDLLLKELESLEKEYPELITADSPTRRVGGEPLKSFENFTHPFKMLSLANAMSEAEFRDFYDRVLKEAGSGGLFHAAEFACEHKFDGLAIELIYENGLLVSASTRGNGEIGELITSNARTIRSIPLKLSGKYPSFIAVYGEVLMFKEDFIRLNLEREENGEPLFANPRNAAAGSIRQLDPSVTAGRNLRFQAYGVRTRADEPIVNKILFHSKRMDYLKGIGFPVALNRITTGSLEEIIQYHARWESERDTLPYDIDGVVIKVDDIALQDSLGYDARTPKWAAAWKFKPARAQTVLRQVEFSVGRQGTITPTAVFDPVFLAGAKITRATLHNFDEVKRLGARIGDTIVVERSGEVIPKVVDVLKEKRTGETSEIVPPEVCPVCGAAVTQAEGIVAFRCVNASCPAVLKGGIRHFVSRNAFNIEGMGEEIVGRFFELGLIRDFADIFLLKERRDELVQLERFGEKSVDNLLHSIENSKKIEYWRFINSLGIVNVGEETSRLLALSCSPVEKLYTITDAELLAINGIGDVVAANIISYFRSEENEKLIHKMQAAGLTILYPEITIAADSKISGLKIVFTGKAEKFTREEFADLVRRNGGQPSDSVSKNTDILVVGENAGSKLEKAKQLGVKVMTDGEFLEMLK